MKKIVAVLLLPVLAGLAHAAVARPPDAAVLLRSYYRYLVTQQVGSQVQTMTAQAPKHDGAEAQAAVSAWTGQRMDIVRQELTAQFGEQGRPHFEQFFAAYSEAENKNDPQFLRGLCDALGGPERVVAAGHPNQLKVSRRCPAVAATERPHTEHAAAGRVARARSALGPASRRPGARRAEAVAADHRAAARQRRGTDAGIQAR
ncbi:MAG: hypothetical protein NTY53_16500 [Kiritimatiellaeota bacterium]|nr:hypothetical protein [Kiritimatiellota bacterium]